MGYDPAYRKRWELKHKERLKEIRKYRYQTVFKSKFKRRSYWLNKYKVSKGCEFCGYNENGVALDFDHIDWTSKRFNISHRLAASRLVPLFAEIRKCQLLCANCHRIKTMKEKQFDRKPIPINI